jgi:hypothetical protein
MDIVWAAARMHEGAGDAKCNQQCAAARDVGSHRVVIPVRVVVCEGGRWCGVGRRGCCPERAPGCAGDCPEVPAKGASPVIVAHWHAAGGLIHLTADVAVILCLTSLMSSLRVVGMACQDSEPFALSRCGRAMHCGLAPVGECG